MGGRDHLRTGEVSLAGDAVQGEGSQHRQEEEEAAKLGGDGAGSEIKLLDVRDRSVQGSRGRRPFVVGATGQSGKPLLLEDLADGDGTEGVAIGVEGAADVVDGEVLFAQGNDLLPQGEPLAWGVGPLGR